MAKSVTTGSTSQTATPDKFKVTKFGQLLKRYNALVDWAFAAQGLAGSGLVRSDSPLGRLFSVVAQGGTGKGNPLLPFQLLDASDQLNPGRLRIVTGVLSASRFEWNAIPTGMSDGDDPPFYLTVTGAGAAWLKVVLSISEGAPIAITAVTVEAGSSIPASTIDTGYFFLGSYAYDTSGAFPILKPISAGGDVGYVYAGGHFFW